MRYAMFAAFGAALLATPALAAADDAVVAYGVQRNAVQVRTGDLDLAVAEGRAELDRRVQSAVNRVCGIAVPSDPVPTITAACRADAFANAGRQIDALGGAPVLGGGAGRP